MSVRVYNTLTRSKDEFVPVSPGYVRIYACGVTVYDLSHVGHARSTMVFDVIQRYFRFKGYHVTFVRNFTDIDDRIIRRANEEGVPAAELSERYIRAFREDLAAIGVTPADVEPKATEHIPEMVALIERLVAKGFAYTADGDVYFEIRRFPRYGRLSGKNLDELLAGARVEVDERKRDPRDFALWKSAKPGEPAWPSPWGPGRPGWHIECSAMAMKYLGESFDIHGGGEDLIFPHHECEIAQSEADTGRTFARYWLHNGMVNLRAEKMSKSLGNILTIKEVAKRHERDALRLWLLQTHYRHPIEFGEARLEEAARALQKLRNVVRLATYRTADAGVARGEGPEGLRTTAELDEFLSRVEDERLRREVSAHAAQFVHAMDDDFGTPQAIGALFDLASVIARHGDAVPMVPDLRRTAHVLLSLARTLGLLHEGVEPVRVPSDVSELITLRETARAERDWKRADALREEIRRLGWTVEDTPTGPRPVPQGGA